MKLHKAEYYCIFDQLSNHLKHVHCKGDITIYCADKVENNFLSSSVKGKLMWRKIIKIF